MPFIIKKYILSKETASLLSYGLFRKWLTFFITENWKIILNYVIKFSHKLFNFSRKYYGGGGSQSVNLFMCIQWILDIYASGAYILHF